MGVDSPTGSDSVAAQNGEPPDELGLERLIFFSDAVFAIAITLLVLEIRLPEISLENVPVASPAMDTAILEGLRAIAGKYLGYFLSFAAIGLFWLGHHRTYRYIGRYDTILLLLNLLLLMFIAFIPFPTQLIGDYYGNRITLIFYAAVIILTGMIAAALWWYVTRDASLLKEGVDLQAARRRRRDFFIVPSLFVIAAIVALWSTDVAWVIMWGILVIAIIDELLAASRLRKHGLSTLRNKTFEHTGTTDD